MRMLPGNSRLQGMFRGSFIVLGPVHGRLYLTIAGDELHCLPGKSRIYGEWAATIYNGSTPGGKAVTRRITPEPVLSCNTIFYGIRLDPPASS